MRRCISLVTAFLVFLLILPAGGVLAAPPADRGNQNKNQNQPDPTPDPSSLAPSPVVTSSPAPTVSPAPTTTPVPTSNPTPTATPQSTDNNTTRIVISVPDTSQGIGGTVNLHLDEPAPTDTPTPVPTATPHPKKNQPVAAVVNNPPTDPPESQSKKDPVGQIIAPSSGFVERTLPKEFYQSENLSRGETVSLITLSALFLISGLLLINEKYFNTLFTLIKSSLPNRKTSPSFS